MAFLKTVYSGVYNLILGLTVTVKHMGKHAVTLQYPKERWPMPERSRGCVVLLTDPESNKRMPTKYFFNTAPYASISHSFSLGRGLELTPSVGLRVNLHNVFDNETAPEAGLVLASEKWNLHANFARGFNYTGVYSVWFYKTAWHYQSDTYSELKPERIKHFELGLQVHPNPRTTLDLSIFHDRGENLLRFIPPPPPPPSFANIGEFKKTGVEVSINLIPYRVWCCAR